MKKIISTTLFGAIFMLPQTVFGVICTPAVCDGYSPIIITPAMELQAACLSFTTFGVQVGGKCYTGTSCTSCDTGYELVTVTEHYQLCTNGVSYNICKKKSDPCDGCSGSTTTTLPALPNYQYTATKECVNSECITTYVYSCSQAAYGNYPANCTTDANGTVTSCSGCTACPDATNVYTNAARTIRAKGQMAFAFSTTDTTVDHCILPKGTYYDAGGTFLITGQSAGSSFTSVGCPY